MGREKKEGRRQEVVFWLKSHEIRGDSHLEKGRLTESEDVLAEWRNGDEPGLWVRSVKVIKANNGIGNCPIMGRYS